ncbi:MAG TPA: glycoside hydrolase family 15 protein [Actinomycetota bacterium]|nr:glycoside hydrolase family 15 protein [Actinomycetota bacterium]
MRERAGAPWNARLARDPDGYLPIRGYAAIGDGRTVALVGLDGSIDWLALPNLDSPSVFGALLDASRGGRFSLEPAVPYEATRRYVPDTNVLETTFTTERGAVRLTDALLMDGPGLAPLRELVRMVEGIDGTVPMRWAVEPRFGYAAAHTSIELRGGVPIASAGSDALGIVSFGLGRAEVADRRITGRSEVRGGSTGMLVLSATGQEPLVVPSRDEALERLRLTREAWSSWAAARPDVGPFRDAVVRSGLALRLLVFSPSGAIAGAATTSLPEEIGGVRNWDYRFSWVRDAAATLEALIALDCPVEAEAYFWWLMSASQLSKPDLQVLYRLDGGGRARERTLDLAGYRGSRPVRAGNAAIDQLQLDIYGDLLHCSWLYAETVGELDRDLGARLAGIADLVCGIWRTPDSGIWEVRSEPRHFTHSKMMCWVALDRAIALAASLRVPSDRVERWTRERDAIGAFVEERCWSDRLHSYVRSAGSEELDASVLHASILGYGEPDGDRMLGTLAAIERHLRDGPLVTRYLSDDGLPGEEGAFLACSFWLADAWARAGRTDRAEQLMEQLIAMANDVGLYAEEVDPEDGAFLGNFPQALPHLALIGAAAAIEEARRT